MIKYLLHLLAIAAVCCVANIAHGQTYTPSNRTPQADNSIGTTVNSNGNNFNITGGLQRGQNLFHSFTDFSIPTNGAANFTNPAGNQSIITRVTGNLFSDLNGTLNTNGANFLLINPNGVVFGTNARLNVGKAFVTSTASGIDFVDALGRNYNFGVNKAGDAPLISIDPNVAFNPTRLIMGGGNGQISNYGAIATNAPDRYIGLIGGNVNFNGGKITAPGGRVELGGLAGAGTIDFSLDANNMGVKFPTTGARADVSLTNGSQIFVAGSGGGDITISARNLELLGDSQLQSGIAENSGTPAATAGDINIDATGQIALVGTNTRIRNYVDVNGRGNGGNIILNAGAVSLQDGSLINASTYGVGNAGNVKVTAKSGVSLSNANIFNNVAAGGVGKGGNIEIDAASLSLLDGSQLQTVISFPTSTQPAGTGDAGNIIVKVSGGLELVGRKDGSFSGINSSVQNEGVGKGGNITIDAGAVSLGDNAFLAAATLGQGDAGNIDINSKGNITIAGTSDRQTILNDPDGTPSFIAANSNGRGNAGKISIETPGKLSLLNRGAILNSVSNIASGDSAGISIKAGEVELDRYAKIFSSSSGRGNAGDISIVSNGDLTISEKSSIANQTYNSELSTNLSSGNAGNIFLNVGNFKLIDSGIFSTTSRKGDAGNITIQSKGDITLAGTADNRVDNLNKATIISSSLGVGDAGKISIDAPSGKVSLSYSIVSSSIGDVDVKNASGNSRGIAINARELELKNNSFITSELNGKGRGGNIDIKATGDISISGNERALTANNITQFNISGISSSTRGIGDGGKISIDTQGKFSLDNSGFILNSVSQDAQGTSKGIKINARELNLTNGGFISADTQGKNPGGDIDIVTTGGVNIKNSSIGANSLKSTFAIDLPGIGSQPVSSTGEGKAGNISISSDRLYVDNGFVFALGTSDFGGNITLNLSDKLLLRNGSQITTSSGEYIGGGTGSGSGGNITISSPLIVALPVSNAGSNDITANAYTGTGGKVRIGTQGLFGIQFRPVGTSFTNDITASSTFGQSGTVNINTPGVDPGKDTGELPAAPNDASDRISQACSANRRENKFYVTGRGGLPPNASELLESASPWQDPRGAKTNPATSASQPQQFTPPAVGWVLEKNGRVRLIAAQSAEGATGTKAACPTLTN